MRAANKIASTVVSANTQRLDATALEQNAREPGFALIRTGRAWRLYEHPREVIAVSDGVGFTNSLRQIEEHVSAGGEAAGMLRYEAGYALEPLLRPLLSDKSGTLLWFGLYENVSVFEDIYFPASEQEDLVERLAAPILRSQYREKLDEIRELIAAGEVYQINFTHPLRFYLRSNPWRLFVELCRRHPVPYAAFVNTGDRQIVSLSPELFFHIESERITVKPMKGTAPRGLMLEDDEQRGRELAASEKNRAENVMIVDLMRNDLSRICRTGTVKATRLFEVERFASLWQMTSTIQGDLAEGSTLEDILRALFPSGSVTGAPKIRAMQHIARLETSERDAYTGAIGYFARARAHFSVPIRTAVVQNGEAIMGVGSGITYDSSPEEEWEECECKGAFLTSSAPEFELLETLIWDGEYRLLNEHLERMKSSAVYFGFEFDEHKMRDALQDCASRMGSKPQRVRVTSTREGNVQIEHREISGNLFGRVRISSAQVSSRDHFLYHKTTHRRVYDRELAAAVNAGYDDALFFNERAELTEGAIHNVFIVKDGVWKTPPVECGLLPGTYRRQFLREHPDACAEVLTLEDLLRAEQIYLCNSVRGMQSVELESPAQGQRMRVAVRSPARRCL
jgi:para-aminobenzoate synthetase/4-amino-4-deoxychorismate lyase